MHTHGYIYIYIYIYLYMLRKLAVNPLRRCPSSCSSWASGRSTP